jgi:hypothetical protein
VCAHTSFVQQPPASEPSVQVSHPTRVQLSLRDETVQVARWLLGVSTWTLTKVPMMAPSGGQADPGGAQVDLGGG